jgi:hypothetical protein
MSKYAAMILASMEAFLPAALHSGIHPMVPDGYGDCFAALFIFRGHVSVSYVYFIEF